MRTGEDILSAAAITEGLETTFVGQRVIYYPRLESTMDAARQAARQGVAEGTIVVTEEQAAGRGRLKRVWLTPPGNIALSIILYPCVSSLPYLVMLAAVAVARSVEAVTGLSTQIKWPNDVLIDGKKVCGILVETDVRGNLVAYAIIGIGININLRAADFPDIQNTATSLIAASGREVSRLEVLKRLLVEVERLYLTLPKERQVYEEWRARLVTLGRRVLVRSGETVLEGIAETVDDDGSLLLRRPDGTVTKVIAGDVTLRDANG